MYLGKLGFGEVCEHTELVIRPFKSKEGIDVFGQRGIRGGRSIGSPHYGRIVRIDLYSQRSAMIS